MTEILSQDSGLTDNNEAVAKWYVVHTYSGYENKVKINIEATVENRHLEDQILEVFVPVHEVAEIKNGKSTLKEKKSFPGYVIIHMIMNDDTWYVVRNTRGVTGFVGPGSKPVELTEEEVANLGIKVTNYDVDVEVGDEVIVVSGPWKDTVASIEAINEQKETVKIKVDVFGQENEIDINIADIRKL